MGEFLEYIKQLHQKLLGSKKKKDKFKDLEYDSISEITDLSQEGILTTSMDKLSLIEKRNLNQFIN